MVHSLSGITQAQEGRLDEAMAALRQAERLAVMVEAGDVLATVCGNQANVALMQHRHEQALALAERSVELQEQAGTPHGIGVALASLGQICVRLGKLSRAEQALNRALDVRSPAQFRRETTGAVFDSLAQIHVIRGADDEASASLERARAAYGETRVPAAGISGRSRCSMHAWPCAGTTRAGAELEPRTRACRRCAGVYALQADLIGGRGAARTWPSAEAQAQLEAIVTRIDPAAMSGIWGELLRLRGRLHAAAGRATEAYHDFGQSVSVFELLGERYQAALGHLELGQAREPPPALVPAPSAISAKRAACSTRSAPHLSALRSRSRCAVSAPRPAAATSASSIDGDDAIVRRLVDASAMPALLEREGATAIHEACDATVVALVVDLPAGRSRVLAAAGCDLRNGACTVGRGDPWECVGVTSASNSDPIGRDVDGPRFVVISTERPLPPALRQRLRTLVRGAAAGIRVVPGARAQGRKPGPARSSGSSNRCCQASSAPAPRCSASPTRSSACRGTT